MPDYGDPAVEEQWCDERRSQVVSYLSDEGIEHGRVGDWPAWHVAPYVSVWAIESLKMPDSVGWWVICGDLPTDYVAASNAIDPRGAVREIANRWRELAPYMERGEEHPELSVGAPENWAELAPLLRARVDLLQGWVEDDGIWPD